MTTHAASIFEARQSGWPAFPPESFSGILSKAPEKSKGKLSVKREDLPWWAPTWWYLQTAWRSPSWCQEIQVHKDLLIHHMETGLSHHSAGPHQPDPQVKLAMLSAMEPPKLQPIVDFSLCLVGKSELPWHQTEIPVEQRWPETLPYQSAHSVGAGVGATGSVQEPWLTQWGTTTSAVRNNQMWSYHH